MFSNEKMALRSLLFW